MQKVKEFCDIFLENSCSGLELSRNLSNSAPGAISNADDTGKTASIDSIETIHMRKQRVSKDSAMEDENCRSLSNLTTDSSDQSAPVNFDMSNRVRSITIERFLS